MDGPSPPPFPKLKTLEIVQKRPDVPVFHIYLNNPSTRNALTLDFFSDLPAALSHLDHRLSARAIVLAARGPHFCSGIDLAALRSLVSPPDAAPDPARRCDRLRRAILGLQAAVFALERCRCPVLAAIHGACVGGGVDLAAACDVRYCAEGAWFSVKEVDVGLAADLGSLQRLPAIVGYGNAAEMALTGRRVDGGEAKAMGLVSRVFASKEEMEGQVDAIAGNIAGKSPLAVMGTKAVLQRSRELTVEQGLDYVAAWNASMLKSQDLHEAIAARLQKRKPTFAKL